MRLNYLFYSLILISVFCCQKPGDPDEIVPPEKPEITYTVEGSVTQPGRFVTIKSSETIEQDTVSVTVAQKKVLLIKTDSVHYGFFVPVLPAGIYVFDLTKINGINFPAFEISNYTVIADANKVISDITAVYNALADSLITNALDSAVTAKDAGFMRQVMAQFNENIKLCTDEEKLLLAYQLQDMSLNNSYAKNAQLDTTYLASKNTNGPEDVGKIMVVKALDAEKARLEAFAAAGGVAITGIVAINVPTPVTIGAFLVASINYIYSVNAAKKAASEALNITGIADGDFSEVNGNGTDVKPIVVSIGKTLVQSFFTAYRTLRKKDEVDVISDDVREFIIGTYEMQTKDGAFANTFNNVKTKLSNYFKGITISYTPYVSQVLETAKKKIAGVKSHFISVSNISNNNITVTAGEEGTNGLKLTFDNPAKNITEETDFTFTVTYNQEAIGNKVVFVEKAKFIPIALPKVITTAASLVTEVSASSGGMITDDGGGEILSKGICYGPDPNPVRNIANTNEEGSGPEAFVSSMTDLQPNTTYYVRAFAVNSKGISYGEHISFKTPPQTAGMLYGAISGSYKLVNGVRNYAIPTPDTGGYLLTIQLTSGYIDLVGLSGSAASTMVYSVGTIMGDYSNATIVITDGFSNGVPYLTRTIKLTGTIDGKWWRGEYTNTIVYTNGNIETDFTGGSFGFEKK